MKENRIQSYLQKLESHLWLRGLADKETLAEIESHLLESVEANLQRGLSKDDAEIKALERFGSVKIVASTFEKERKDVMQSILLAAAVLAGLFSAYAGWCLWWMAGPIGNSQDASSGVATEFQNMKHPEFNF